MVKNPLAMQDICDPWVEKIPWRREWLLTPVFLPGEFHEQRSLVRYQFMGSQESDMTGWLKNSNNNGYNTPLIARASLVTQTVKNLPAMRETQGSSPRSGSTSGEGNGYSLQYPCLENSMGRRAWQATVHSVQRVGHDWATNAFTSLTLDT